MTNQQRQQILIFMMGNIIRLGILCLSFLFVSQYNQHYHNYSFYCDGHKNYGEVRWEVRCIAVQEDYYNRSEMNYHLWNDTEFLVYKIYYDSYRDIPYSMSYVGYKANTLEGLSDMT